MTVDVDPSCALFRGLSRKEEDLFYQSLMKLYDMGEVSFENVFIDGTKIEADANRYTFVWAKGVEKNLQKLEQKLWNRQNFNRFHQALFEKDTA